MLLFNQPMKTFLLVIGRTYPAVRQEGEDEYQLVVLLLEGLPTDRGRPPRFRAKTNEGRLVEVALDVQSDTLVLAS